MIDNNIGRSDRLTAPPTSGHYYRGEKVYNKTPEPSGWIGWVCTAEATSTAPMVWEPFGEIGVRQPDAVAAPVTALPTADASWRGKIVRLEVAAADDKLYVCKKLASGTYAWVEIQ